MAGTNLSTHPVHLRLGASAEIEPEFTGDMAWYGAYGARHSDDGTEGRLVSQFTFTQPWSTWEMHPNGHEVVLCVAGTMVLHQERPDGSHTQVTLEPGQYAINAPGVWHTADVSGSATGVFITAGMGTQIRPR
ncbi:MAG TPA: hypothetical protein VKR31_14410 [Rhizomicrobium sp.]|nr:hypothetical protein [Rhizomicrobium sp.]